MSSNLSRSRRRCSASLPLPLPSYSPNFFLDMKKPPAIYHVLEDMVDQVLLNLRDVEKNLDFWESKTQDSDFWKLYFTMFERGPQAFIDATARFLHLSKCKDPQIQTMSQYASFYISNRVAVLTVLRYSLAAFLSKVYMELERCGEHLEKNPQSSLPSLLAAPLNRLFFGLQGYIGGIRAFFQTDFSVDGSYLMPLLFEKLPEPNQQDSNLTDCEVAYAVNLVNKNLQKLDSSLSFLIAKYQEPKKTTRYWIRYTCGAIGLSVCSVLLLRHSSVVRSYAKGSLFSFFIQHVGQSVLFVRDKLLGTFWKTNKGVVKIEHVHSTADSLQRMQLAFSEETKSQNFPENASHEEMLERAMARYENPIQNLGNGDCTRALGIQVGKLKYALLAALPTFLLSHTLLMGIRARFKRDTRGRGSRQMLQAVQSYLMNYQAYIDLGCEEESHAMFGLMLYYLDRLYRDVGWDAQLTGEWKF